MTSRLIHIDAYEQGIKRVKVIGVERWYLRVQLPDESEALVYRSDELNRTIKKHITTSDFEKFEDIIGYEIEAVKKKNHCNISKVKWEVVIPPSTKSIPTYLLKDKFEN